MSTKNKKSDEMADTHSTSSESAATPSQGVERLPKRIQRKRTRGWRMPPNTFYVGRPTPWGNPYKIGETYCNRYTNHKEVAATPENIIELFENFAEVFLITMPSWLDLLRGKDLACFCKEGAPCHADVLLRLANGQDLSDEPNHTRS